MKIKSLEIIGFKSFVDKVSLDFQQDVTGIVGPNGCGKSNIVDAIRWGMGEQSAKNLRGKQMEDIIFGGSDSRKPLGMAEVSLVFSTNDGKVPAKYLNFNEIQVTRRLYRDGESEYFINKTPCRLLDITELFMDTGVGARAYSIIEQGKIGIILHSKPEDRRFLIEEAAGVTKFKARKQVALKKIEHTRQNLLRLNDILSEIKRQLNALQRQAKKAEKFREYREELKEIEQFAAVRTYRDLQEENRQLEAARTSASQQADDAAILRHTRETVLEDKRICLLDAESSVAATQEKLFAVKAELQKAENAVVLARNELESLERQALRGRDELTSISAQIEDAERDLAGQILQHEEAVSGLEEAEATLLDRQELLDEMVRTELGVTRDLEEKRKSLFSILSEIAQTANAERLAVKKLEAVREKIDRNSRENILFLEKQAVAAEGVLDLEKRLESLRNEKQAAGELLRAAEARIADVKGALPEVERVLQTTMAELHSTASRLRSLQELQAAYEGFGSGVRNLLLSDGFRSRFSGVVADFVDTTEEYEVALEAYLGDRLQYLVCSGDGHAVDAISHLKETGAGRSSFIFNTITPSELGGATPVGDSLLCKIRIDETHRPFIEPLLKNVFLAVDLPSAISQSQTYPQCHFVTPVGETVSGGGIVTGGSPESAGQGLVHKKREIRELSALKEELTEKVAQLTDQRDELRNELAAAESEVGRARSDVHRTDMLLLTAEKDLQRARDERQRIEERITLKQLEDDQLAEEKDLLEKEVRESVVVVAGQVERKNLLEAEVKVLTERISEQKEMLEETRNLVTSVKVRSASMKEKREATSKTISRLHELIDRLKNRAVIMETNRTTEDEERTRLSNLLASGEVIVRKLVLEVARAESALAAAKQEYDEGVAVIREEESALRSINAQYEALRQQTSDLTIKLSESGLRLRHVEDSVVEKWRVSLLDLVPKFQETDWSPSDKKRRQVELQNLVDEMGEVNLTAIDEYRELEERFSFLSSQKADLEESMHSLQQAIQKINRTTRKRFSETFHLVNAQFQEIFPRLFCGGKAELRLTDEEDLLETGIDIIVQPPGKKLQNVTLLSGGEKALTALSLIFAIFLIKPSPFCLLDEVDAPLDDANIGRFNDMVRDMSRISQFIMITHNKGTMAVADTLYGITMEEPGVSKVVSVKLS